MTTYTRKHLTTTWHLKHWFMMFMTGGLWAPFYWLFYHRARRPILEHYNAR